jgi:hypothetical protein
VSTLKPSKVVASFDSATVLQAALAAALRGEAFPHLGQSPAAALAVRSAGRLPWPLLRQLYARIGASEGIDPSRLGDVDLGEVAKMLVDDIPARPYPAVLLGSSNGALTHLAAAMQVPWLPGTVLVPVARQGDPERPVDALEFGHRTARPLLERNPDIELHHMHDQVQDELMVAHMTYFRTKWQDLPDAYAGFLSRWLMPGAPVVLVEDTSRWPVTRVSERHVFQAGAQGGRDPEYYLSRRHTPRADDEAPEAEWGADAGFGSAVERWCRSHDHPLIRISYAGPQAPAAPVAETLRDWHQRSGAPADRLVVPSFVLGDPWTTILKGAVPFWTFFSVQAALDSLRAYLEDAAPYRDVDLMLFQHGVPSPGIAGPEEWLRVAEVNGAHARLLGLDARRFPHDIAAIARYGPALRELPEKGRPWTPLDVTTAVQGLSRSSSLSVLTESEGVSTSDRPAGPR